MYTVAEGAIVTHDFRDMRNPQPHPNASRFLLMLTGLLYGALIWFCMVGQSGCIR